MRLLWAASARTRDVLCYAPTNILLDAIPTRRGLKWGVPGWRNLLVVLAGWNMPKFILIGPISLVLLERARILEAMPRHRAQGESEATTREESTATRVG